MTSLIDKLYVSSVSRYFIVDKDQRKRYILDIEKDNVILRDIKAGWLGKLTVDKNDDKCIVAYYNIIYEDNSKDILTIQIHDQPINETYPSIVMLIENIVIQRGFLVHESRKLTPKKECIII
jgi:hypothetical protein